MARRPDVRIQQRWLERIRRWQQSQLTVRAFCSRQRLSEPRFYAWRRLLRQRGLLATEAAAPPTAKAATPASTFVELALPTEPRPTAALELVLGHQRVLRISPGFDPDTLRQLVHLLEEPPC